MLLYVMRHGPAEDRAASGRDFDRALTAAGRLVVAKAARALHEARAGRSMRLLVSPLRRARETAEIVARESSPAWVVEEHDDLAADAGLPLALVEALAEAGADALLIGHQPTVEELVRDLLRPSAPPLANGFRTAFVLGLEKAGDAWRVVRVIDPHS